MRHDYLPRPLRRDRRPSALLRTRSDWSASGIYGLRRDVKPGHGLMRVLSFPSPSGWRDQMTAFIGRREFITLLGGAAACGRSRRGRSRASAADPRLRLKEPQSISSALMMGRSSRQE